MVPDHEPSAGAATSQESFRFTYIPYFVDENGAKRPSLLKGFSYEGFSYGSVTPPARSVPHHGWGLVTSRASGLIAVDIDRLAGFGSTAIGALLEPLLDQLRGAVKAGGAEKRHVYLDGRAWPGEWPTQWATHDWPYDLKTSGFVRGEPDYLPHPGIMLPWSGSLVSAVEADKTECRILFPPPQNANGHGVATGAVSGWTRDMPDACVTDDNTLSACVMSMARAGLSREEAYPEWLRIQYAVDAEWTDADFDRHWSAKVEDAYWEAVNDRDAWDVLIAGTGATPESIAERVARAQAFIPQQEMAGVGAGGNGNGSGHNGNGYPPDRPPTPYEQMAAGGPFQLTSWDETQIADEILRRVVGTLAYAPGIGGWIADRGPVWETVEAGTYVAALGALCPVVTDLPADGEIQDPPEPEIAPIGASPADKAAVKARNKAAADAVKAHNKAVTASQKDAALVVKRCNDARTKLRSDSGNTALGHQMARLAAAHGAVVKGEDLDSADELLWAGGRLWNLRTMEEEDGRGIPHLKNAPCAPDFTGTAPCFEALMEAIYPDEEIRTWALRVFGHIVHGKTDKRAGIIELRGPANTAKSSLARCLSFALGTGSGYATDIEDDLFDGTIETARAFGPVPGSRLVYLDEWSDRKGKISRTRLKKLTGGQRFKARLLYCDPADFEPHHTFMVSLNPDVSLPYDDPAVRARVVSIPHACTDLEGIRTATNAALSALRTEAPAILAMLMRSAAKVLEDPLSGTMDDAPAEAAKAFLEAADQADDLSVWLMDEMSVGDRPGVLPHAEETDIGDLLTQYNLWAGSYHPHIHSTRVLGRRLAGLIGTELHRESHGRSLWKIRRRVYETAQRD